MIKPGEPVFVDTGAWIALAVTRDPLHERAAAGWAAAQAAGAKLRTSLPVVLETFTYLDRKGSRPLADAWRRSLSEVPRFAVSPATSGDLEQAWRWLDRKEFTRLGLVDATSFAIMRREKIRLALAFDVHFATAGFTCLG